ncbi:FHA domain-containing protein [Geodermatophilus sp. URMC 65]
MGDGTARIGVEAGAGLVGRFGEAVVLVAPETAADDVPTGQLLDLVEAAASETGRPGAAIAARLAGWVGGRTPVDESAFGLVAPVEDGVVVFLRGAVWAEVVGSGTTRRLSGRQALTWVDQVVPLPFEQVTIGSEGEGPVRVHPRSELRSGVVPARGFVLTPSGGSPAAAAEPVGSAAAAAPTAPVGPAATAEPGPEPVADRRGRPATTETLTPHPSSASSADQDTLPAPSDPRAEPEEPGRPDTARIGAPPEEQPVDVGMTVLAAPPVGALAAEGGPTILLDRDYVLGREPHNDPSVQDASASPVVLRDPDNLISRVHAYVSVGDGSVFVRDAPSVSGTYVAAPGAEGWTRVGTEPTRLPPEWSLRVGTRVFVFKPTGAARHG